MVKIVVCFPYSSVQLTKEIARNLSTSILKNSNIRYWVYGLKYSSTLPVNQFEIILL